MKKKKKSNLPAVDFPSYPYIKAKLGNQGDDDIGLGLSSMGWSWDALVGGENVNRP